MDNKKLRIVCLFGTGIIFDKTLSILLENNVNVVGVCHANKHKKGLDFSLIFHSFDVPSQHKQLIT